MWYNHDEFICVRLKHHKFRQNLLNVKRINCRWGQVYLCSKKTDFSLETRNGSTVGDTRCKNLLCDLGRDWVIKSLKEGFKCDELQAQVEKWSISYSATNKNDLLHNGM